VSTSYDYKSDSIQFQFYFGGAAETLVPPTAFATWVPSSVAPTEYTVYFGRNIDLSAADQQSFLPVNDTRYKPDDPDVSTDLASTLADAISQSRLYIGIFALGYGLDGQTFQELYSIPVPIIYTSLQGNAYSYTN